MLRSNFGEFDVFRQMYDHDHESLILNDFARLVS